MNTLSTEEKIQVLNHLVEGMSLRAIERLTGIQRKTITRLLVNCGEKAQDALDTHLVDLNSERIEMDEIWCYIGMKEKRVHWVDRIERPELGDTYVFVAMDADSKLVPCFRAGKRNTETAIDILSDLRGRLRNRIQLTTDSFKSYNVAVRRVFGQDIDYGQVHKKYREAYVAQKRYSPARLIGISMREVIGEPNTKYISTSYVERQNLTMRMQMRRFTRLTNAFSKKFENLVAACALHFYHYNFLRTHQSLRMTPAMAVGVTDRVWDWTPVLR